jgi:predicted signal transduction protein with EAL and GGDEF domain
VARLGGDEFAIILPELDRAAVEAGLFDRLFADLAGPMVHDGRQIEVSLSAGSALAFADGDSSEDLHKSADLALYAAKSEGGPYLRLPPRHARRGGEPAPDAVRCARGLTRGSHHPFLPAQGLAAHGECVGFEALLRWHDHQGLQQPAAIKAAFDDPGLSVQLTDRMLDRVIADMRGWQDRGIAFHCIAINGSAGISCAAILRSAFWNGCTGPGSLLAASSWK